MYKKTTLPNGVRIVTEEMSSVHSVSIGFWIGCGSRDENEKEAGLSHFLEHLLFKGTKDRTSKEIAETFDAIGGHLNAFTTKEYTCLYAKVLTEHFQLALDVLSDMLFNSSYKSQDIEKEKKVVLEEIKMYLDTPDDIIHDIYSQVVWPDHSLGKPILGDSDSISGLTREEIVHYFVEHYITNRLVIAIAGNIEHDIAVEQISNIFAKMPMASKGREFSAASSISNHKCIHKDVEQLQVCLGVPGLAQEDKDIFSLHVLNNVLGGGLSSRLFQKVREDHGLAYSVFSYPSTYIDSGLYTIYAGTSPENFEQLIEIILDEINQIKHYGITEKELKRSIEQIRGNLLLGMESTSNRMSRLGKTELCYGRVITAEELTKSISGVSLESVKATANRLFRKELFSLATMGKIDVSQAWERLIASRI